MYKMKLVKIASLCCILILSTATQETSRDELKSSKKDENVSKHHALVALDVDLSDEEDHATVESFLEEGAEKFIPTHEWQTVKPGQAVPRGLHIRLNLQTGVREAKLMDEDNSNIHGNYYMMHSESKDKRIPDHKLLKDELEKAVKELKLDQEGEEAMKYWKNKDREGMVNLKKPSFTHGELKEALKKFKAERDDVQDPNVKAESSKRSFRTIDEIQEEFRKLKIDMKTDLEILTNMMQSYKSSDINDRDRVMLLKELEYYVHQIDNAQNFASMDGIYFLIRDLNSTSEEVREEAALVLASAVQSNPKVQVTAFENGAMQKLIRMLSVESSIEIRARVLTALSSLIRNFPYAQLKFLELGGLDSLSQLLRQPMLIEKLCIKAVTLVNDLIVEQLSTLDDGDISAVLRSEKLNQYSRIPLLESVVEQGWCHLVPSLLGVANHDSKEKVLNVMWILKDKCQADFFHALPQLQILQKKYKQLSLMEIEEDGVSAEESYFGSVMLRNIDRLVKHIGQPKDEL